ncbi:unnamed protein product [Brassica rapa subsp. trilocularis]
MGLNNPGVSAFPEEDNIFCWKGAIKGSKETVFEGLIKKKKKRLCLKELSTDSHSLSPMTILSSLQRSSSRLLASTPMLMSMAISAWTFFRLDIYKYNFHLYLLC